MNTPKNSETQWIYGLHAVSAALKNPARRCLELMTSSQTSFDVVQKEAGQHPQLKILKVDRAKMHSQFGEDTVHQGVALKATLLPEPDLEDLLENQDPQSLCLLLDQVTDPHNLGAILRNAAAFGVSALVIPDRHSPPSSSPVVAKVASGALEQVPLIRVVNLVRAMEELQQAGYWCAGLAEEGQQMIHEADMKGKLAVVMGAEGDGLRRLTKDTCDFLLRLPTSAQFSTLNVASATAVTLYEVRRQQGVK